MSCVIFSDLTGTLMTPLSFDELVVAALLRCPDNTGCSIYILRIMSTMCPEINRLYVGEQNFIESFFIEKVGRHMYRLKDGWKEDLPWIIIVNGMEYHVATRTYNEWVRYLHRLSHRPVSKSRTSSINDKDLIERTGEKQCVQVKCRETQCIPMKYEATQCVAVKCRETQCVPMEYGTMECVQVKCEATQCIPMGYGTMKCVPVKCEAAQCIPMEYEIMESDVQTTSFVTGSTRPLSQKCRMFSIDELIRT